MRVCVCACVRVCACMCMCMRKGTSVGRYLLAAVSLAQQLHQRCTATSRLGALLRIVLHHAFSQLSEGATAMGRWRRLQLLLQPDDLILQGLW